MGHIHATAAVVRKGYRIVRRALLLCGVLAAFAGQSSACTRVLYLTLDTGNMASAELIASILAKHQVKATFFLANEKTPEGNNSLDLRWRDYWRARVEEGHAFGNHTFDHVYFSPAAGRPRGPASGPAAESVDERFHARPQFGVHAGKTLHWNQAALCAELARVDQRFQELTGARLSGWWRAPGGRAPNEVHRAARECGYRHVHWAPAGFLGDELPSDRYPNIHLVSKALRDIRAGDILMAHLGIWSRREAYAPALDPLIEGLKAKGFCFRTLHEHPDFKAATAGQ
jgi:peptidoglycan/xylan/chitin deacetylase (PgdA/CDA1 family)